MESLTTESAKEPPELGSEKPAAGRDGQCFDAHQYSFFTTTNSGSLELESGTGLEEGVEAPPEEDFFQCCVDSEVDPNFTFDSFEEVAPPPPPPATLNPTPAPTDQSRPVLLVAELEKQLQSASSSRPSPSQLTVAEVEAQMRLQSNPLTLGLSGLQSTSFHPGTSSLTQAFNYFQLNNNNSGTGAVESGGGPPAPPFGRFGGQPQPHHHHQQQHLQHSWTQQQPTISRMQQTTSMLGGGGGGGGSGPFAASCSSQPSVFLGSSSGGHYHHQHQLLQHSHHHHPFSSQSSAATSLTGGQNFRMTGGRVVGGGGGYGDYGSPSLSCPPMMAMVPTVTQKYKFMSSGEIEKILAFQVQNVHMQNPYSDDYYYHAFMKKYRKGACRFSPLSVKELEHQEQTMKAEVKFADLQGLGKIPFSNLRTPRPLIDCLESESLTSAEEDDRGGLPSIQWEFIRSAQRLQAMHARKLIEDSMCLLLEVDDVDRLAMSECGKVDLRKLASRRRDLIGSIVEAFRIPSTPEGLVTAVGTGGRYVPNSDGVFLRLMSIAKGRSLLAKLLNVLVPPRPFQALPTDTKPLSYICWTTLRNIRALFGPTTWITKQGIDVDISSLSVETSKIAVGLKEVILALKSASDVCRAFEALAKGDLMSSADGSVVTPEEMLLPFLPPNHVPGCKPCIWLEAVLVALLQRALEVGLAQRIGFTHPTGAYMDFELMTKWDWVFGVLYEAVTAHLKVLVQVHRVAKERNQPQALEYAKGLLGKDLLTATLMLCNQLQFSKVKQIVNALLEW